MTDLTQITASAGADVPINRNFQAVSPAALYGRRYGDDTGGLDLGLYGGLFGGNDIADSVVTLDASEATLYVVAERATGTVTFDTANTDWNDTTDFFRIGIATTGASTVTAWVDHREAYAAPVAGGGGSSAWGDLTGVPAPIEDIAALTDPGADRLLMWDDSASEYTHATLGTNLSFTGTTLNAAGGGAPNWGDIGGTLSDQTDLQAALDDKADAAAVATALAGKQDSNVNLDDLAALTDPGGDRLLFWDDSAGAYAHLQLGTNLSITGTTLDAAGGGGGSGDVVGPASSVADRVVTFDGTTGKLIKDSGTLLSALAPKASPALTGTATSVNMTFSGLLTTVASATGGAGLNLPHGAAPTSPVNGDLWTTTAGIYGRINGATVGPLSAGGGGSPGGSTTQVQYNSGGAFAGEAAFTYDDSTNTLTVDKINTAKGADIARATTTDIGAATGNYVDLTGTTTVTGLGTVAAGAIRLVRFSGAGTLTHNGTSLILPGAASITTANNDTAIFVSLGSGNWRCIGYSRASGLPIVNPTVSVASLTNFTGSLNTASPNNGVNAARLLVTGGTTHVDFVAQPKGTNGSFLLQLPDATAAGGDKRGVRSVDLQLSRVNATAVVSGDDSFAAGGDNTVSAQYSFAIGTNNNVSGIGSSARGTSNAVSGANSAADGIQNTVSGIGAYASGQTNRADGNYSQATGNGSSARSVYGALAHSSGAYSVQGDNQYRDFHLSLTTTNATPAPLTAANGTAGTSNQLTVPLDGIVAFEAIISAKVQSGNDVKGWLVTGVAKNIGGTTTLVGTPTVAVLGADAGASAWTIAVAADNTNDAVAFNATGVAATVIVWSAVVRSSEVAVS